MATVILIVFLVALTLGGGWWLKKERVNQKNDLLRQGRIAEGKFDDVPAPKKPKRKKQKKPASSWFDAKYVPPEVPDKAMMEGWQKRAASAVDRALPAVQAYRLARAAHEKLQEEAQAAERQAGSMYVLKTANAVYNFGLIEEAMAAKYETSQRAQESARHLRREFKATRDLVLDVRSCLSQVEGWELYKAPETFHDLVEVVTLVGGEILREFELDNEPDAVEQKDSRSKRRHSWDAPEAEPVKDETIVEQTRIAFVRALEMLPGLVALVNSASDGLKHYEQIAASISLAKPEKPVDIEIAASIKQATDAATLLQEAQLAVYERAQMYSERRAVFDDALGVVRARVQFMSSADIPDSHQAGRDAILYAIKQINAYFEALEKWLVNLHRVPHPYQVDTQETQAMQDAAASLRNLVRKVYFAVAQAQSAVASAAKSKSETPRLAEVNAPTLSQSGAQAFVNAFARMEEIQTRNKQKTDEHGQKCKHLQAQAVEREGLAKAAVQELKELGNDLDKRFSARSADYDVSRKVAALVCRAF
jgi:hypothetical protein